MTRHFGVLIPSTNTTVEIECRLLPPTYQAHIGRLLSSGGSFSPSRDEDIDYQSRLLGTAKVELVILAQTSASLVADDYDDVVTDRKSTRLNSSHVRISYAVFCLKKKKTKRTIMQTETQTMQTDTTLSITQ